MPVRLQRSGCATRPRAQEIGLTGSAAPTQPSALIGRYVMATAEHREPCESTGSCTVLGAPGGESPSGDSSFSTFQARAELVWCKPTIGSAERAQSLRRRANSGSVALIAPVRAMLVAARNPRPFVHCSCATSAPFAGLPPRRRHSLAWVITGRHHRSPISLPLDCFGTQLIARSAFYR